MKHAHAELLHRLADDCTSQVWVWEFEEWRPVSMSSLAYDKVGDRQYALGDKPTSPPKRYAMVEGVKVPMTHLTVAPEVKNQKYWFLNSESRAGWDCFVGAEADANRFATRNCYATKEDAQEAATAWAQVRRQASERAK